MKLDRRSLAYACIPFALGLVHCSFYFFYVKMFLNVYKVSEWWFQFSQIVFMIWNTINDPLIGYLMNNPKWKCSKIRRLPILYSGPLYCLTFLVPWFPWGDYKPREWLSGVHLTFSLCLYDTLFSYIGLTGCCLLTEMNEDYKQRLNMKWYSSLATILSGWSVPFLNMLSDNLNSLRGFQVGAIALAVLAHFALRYCGKHATTVYEENKNVLIDCEPQTEKTVPLSGSCCRANAVTLKVSENTDCAGEESSWTLTKRILSSRDFMSFILAEFLESFHLTFWGSFTAIFVDNLVPISSVAKSAFFGLTSILPAVLYLFLREPFERYGYYRLYMANMISKVAFSCAMWYLGPQPLLYLSFIFIDHVLGDTFARMADVMMSDVTEQLMRQSSRSHPNSSVLVGLNAFLTKPAQSLAPMLVVNILNRAGYHRYVDGALASNSAELRYLRGVMFSVSCAVPLFVGLLQMCAWSFYKIRSHERPTNGGIVA